jgi:hypothetical protein
MAESKNENNPLLFWSILLLALGLVAYKWYNSANKTELYHNLIIIGVIMLGVALVLGALILLIRGHALKEEKSKNAAKTLLIIISITIIGSFIYRTFFVKIIFDYTYVFHGLLSLVIFSYYNYKFHFKIFHNKMARKARAEKVAQEKEEIDTFLRKDLSILWSEDLRSLKREFEWKLPPEELQGYAQKIRQKITELEKILERKIEEDKLKKILDERNHVLKELENIQDQKYQEEVDEEQRELALLDKLEDEGNVIKKEDLSEEERKILLENDYKQVNEYCVYEQKIITVLVKQILNHLPTHTFLVWSVLRLLADFEVKNLKSHDTREADITFKYKHQLYAIEIETGSLLTRKKQLEDKVKYLNRRYPKKWFFVVSNKNLQPKYRKYGVATQRVGVEKFLKKMLKLRTQ